MSKWAIIYLFSFISGFITRGQNAELENKLRSYFENIPVLQTQDSILKFVLAGTAKYETSISRDSLTKAVTEFDIRVYYYNDTILNHDTHIFYRSEIPDKFGGVWIYLSFIGIKFNTNTTLGAKIGYQNLKRN